MEAPSRYLESNSGEILRYNIGRHQQRNGVKTKRVGELNYGDHAKRKGKIHKQNPRGTAMLRRWTEEETLRRGLSRRSQKVGIQGSRGYQGRSSSNVKGIQEVEEDKTEKCPLALAKWRSLWRLRQMALLSLVTSGEFNKGL